MSLTEYMSPTGYIARARTIAGFSHAGAVYRGLKRIAHFVVGADQERRYRRSAKSWGEGTRTNGLVEVSELHGLSVGRNVHIGHRSLIRAGGGVSIGDNTHISRECIIYSENHNYEGSRLPYDETVRPRPVSIGKNVWIGIRVLVLPGAEIGDGAIIGAGSTVAGRVKALEIIGDPKGQPVSSRALEHYERLEADGSYGGKGGARI